MLDKLFPQLVDKSNLKSISGLDATFLYAETPTCPMHVCSVIILEGSLKYETFRDTVEGRIHLFPRLRQRLMFVPLSIDYPYWVDDPNFDIDMHFNRIALPKPGGWSELRAVASKIHSEPLDRTRPMWEFTFIEGLDSLSQVPKGSVAIISKIHHVAIDGVGGTGLLSVLFDTTPDPKPVPPPKPFKPKPIPNEFSLMLNSTLTFAEDPLKLPRILANALNSTIKTGFLSRMQYAELPTTPFTAPSTPLNGIVSPRRKWNSTILSFARVKKLKEIMDTTLNDIILAICAGALRRYLKEKNKLPNKPLVACVPVSIRGTEEMGNSSNQISNMLVQLATTIEDPIERLEIIHENTIRSKIFHNAMGAKTLANMAETVPFGVANQAARLYSRFNLATMHNPAYNVMITNVPGPQFPFYLNGHKVVNIMGMAPVIDGMGLIIAVLSYNGSITISPTSDAKSMPDIDVFSRYIREEANELEALILQQDTEKQKQEVPNTSSSEIEEVFQLIKQFFKDHPDEVPQNKGQLLFQITGEDTVNWQVNFNKSPIQVKNTKARKPDVVYTLHEDHFIRLAQKEIDATSAQIQGRLKVEGEPEIAEQLDEIFLKIAYKSSKEAAKV